MTFRLQYLHMVFAKRKNSEQNGILKLRKVATLVTCKSGPNRTATWNSVTLELRNAQTYLDLGTMELWLLGCKAESIMYGIACMCLHCPDEPPFAKEHLCPLAVSVSGPTTFQGSRVSQNAEHFVAVAWCLPAYKLQEFLRGPGKGLCPKGPN